MKIASICNKAEFRRRQKTGQDDADDELDSLYTHPFNHAPTEGIHRLVFKGIHMD
jgi:hypothetical protein